MINPSVHFNATYSVPTRSQNSGSKGFAPRSEFRMLLKGFTPKAVMIQPSPQTLQGVAGRSRGFLRLQAAGSVARVPPESRTTSQKPRVQEPGASMQASSPIILEHSEPPQPANPLPPRNRTPAGGVSPTPPPAPPQPNPTTQEQSGFVRANATVAPHVPRYTSVPDEVKYPMGPFHQAPPEYGGEWWQVTPFTGPRPWVRYSTQPIRASEMPLPEGFVELFGERPRPTDFSGHLEYRVARVKWEQDLKYFQGVGIPDGYDQTQVDLASQAFAEWGLGRPEFYQGRYGWRVRFPESANRNFEMSAATALRAPHIVIAQYQIRSLQLGNSPADAHPWVPPHLSTKTG